MTIVEMADDLRASGWTVTAQVGEISGLIKVRRALPVAYDMTVCLELGQLCSVVVRDGLDQVIGAADVGLGRGAMLTLVDLATAGTVVG